MHSDSDQGEEASLGKEIDIDVQGERGRPRDCVARGLRGSMSARGKEERRGEFECNGNDGRETCGRRLSKETDYGRDKVIVKARDGESRRDWDRDRDRKRALERSRDRDKDRDREWVMDRERGRDKDMDRDTHNDGDGVRDRDRDRDSDRHRARDRHVDGNGIRDRHGVRGKCDEDLTGDCYHGSKTDRSEHDMNTGWGRNKGRDRANDGNQDWDRVWKSKNAGMDRVWSRPTRTRAQQYHRCQNADSPLESDSGGNTLRNTDGQSHVHTDADYDSEACGGRLRGKERRRQCETADSISSSDSVEEVCVKGFSLCASLGMLCVQKSPGMNYGVQVDSVCVHAPQSHKKAFQTAQSSSVALDTWSVLRGSPTKDTNAKGYAQSPPKCGMRTKRGGGRGGGGQQV